MRTKKEIVSKIKELEFQIERMESSTVSNPVGLARLEAGRNWLLWVI